MNLTKSLRTIFFLTMFLVSINLIADDNNPPKEIVIHENSQDGGIPRMPDYGQTLSCYLFEDGIRFYAPYNDVLNVVIYNIDNGEQMIYEAVILNGFSNTLGLVGEGYYEISINTYYGKSYSGSFNIEAN